LVTREDAPNAMGRTLRTPMLAAPILGCCCVKLRVGASHRETP
jgi:hypothetical protein